MNKWISAVLIFALVSASAGCAKKAETPPVSPAPAEIVSAEHSPPDEAAIKVQLKAALEACASVFDITKEPEKGYFDPTQEQYEHMLEQVAALGVPVTARDCDMRNYEQVAAFYEDAKAGKDSFVSVYSIRNYGVLEELFISQDGVISHILSGVDFSEPDDYSVNPVSTVKTFEMTERGHLLYTTARSGVDDMTNGLCVLPHVEELLELRRTYVDPVGYSAGGTLTVNWDQSNLSSLNWEYLFETLNFYQTGNFILDAFTEPHPSGDDRLAIPAEQVETLLQAYFPVSVEQLHQLKRYDAARNVYAWRGFWGGGYSPSPEVISCTENPDGSLTLTVGALALEWGQEYTFTSELTVMPRSDGSFQYLANKTDSEMRAWEND